LTANQTSDTIEAMKKPTKIALSVGAVLGATLFAGWAISKSLEAQIERAAYPPPYKVKGRLVSIIIPTLEEENYLPKLLQTVQNQTYFPIESVVADSSPSPSKEKTEEICRAYGARYIFVPKLNVAQARNEGALASSGEILVFTDADCQFVSNYIERVAGALSKGYLLAHASDPVTEGGLLAPLTVIARSGLKPSHWTSGRGIAIGRDLFFDIGGYNPDLDPTLGYREDLDLGFRIAAQFGTQKIKYFSTPMVAESPRRMLLLGNASWLKVRGVRNGKVIAV
jgi:glycosyltransferase involved in cell wall biosynthesis